MIDVVEVVLELSQRMTGKILTFTRLENKILLTLNNENAPALMHLPYPVHAVLLPEYRLTY